MEGANSYPLPIKNMVSCRIGGAKVLLAGVFIWSLGTLIAPPCAKLGAHTWYRSPDAAMLWIECGWSRPWAPGQGVARERALCVMRAAGILALCASRVLVGLGEGLAPSAATSVLAATIPE